VARFNTLIHESKVDEAADVFRALRATYPEEDFVYFHVFQDLMEKAVATRRFNDALKLATMNAELHPDHFAVQAQLGRAYRLAGDQVNAEKCLKRSLQLCPGNAVALEELEQVNKNLNARPGASSTTPERAGPLQLSLAL
jgi:predicted Zn-dependent protease